MIDTIMIDLDGTLLQFSQKAFINVYFTELKKNFIKLDMDADSAVAAVWEGTKAMLLNDGSKLNTQRFWQKFAECLGLTGSRLSAVEASCDDFYRNEFNKAKSLFEPNDVPKRIVRNMASKGYDIVLATNPLFPLCAVESRLDWIGLCTQDFIFITHYANSTYCKPNPEYYREILSKINKTPEQCLMAGNNPVEDMSAGVLGMETFLVTDFLENETNTDITGFRHGTLTELETFLMSLPDVTRGQ